MKLSTSILSSVFILSALSNVTGVRLLSSKNLKKRDLDSPAAVRALKKEKKKKCRPAKVDLEDYSLWSQNSGYWYERRTYEPLSPLSLQGYEEIVFEKTEVEGNEIKIKTFYAGEDYTYFDSSTITSEACTKRKKKQKNGIVSNGVGKITNISGNVTAWNSTLAQEDYDIEFYGNPHVSKNDDKLNIEISIPYLYYESRTVTFFDGDSLGIFEDNANTTKFVSGFVNYYGGVQFYNGVGIKIDNEDLVPYYADSTLSLVGLESDNDFVKYFFDFFGILPIG